MNARTARRTQPTLMKGMPQMMTRRALQDVSNQDVSVVKNLVDVGKVNAMKCIAGVFSYYFVSFGLLSFSTSSFFDFALLCIVSWCLQTIVGEKGDTNNASASIRRREKSSRRYARKVLYHPYHVFSGSLDVNLVFLYIK